jgi:hypothetical protein
MAIYTIILSLLALVVSAFALFFSLRSRASSVPKHGIRGDIEITNDCDGLAASIPTHVKVKANLYGAPGQYSGASATIGPLGVDPNNPIKRGTYNLSVGWDQALGAPTEWKLWITKADGTEICPPITCPVPVPPVPLDCKDQVAKPYVWRHTSSAMTKEVKVSCSCVQP